MTTGQRLDNLEQAFIRMVEVQGQVVDLVTALNARMDRFEETLERFGETMNRFEEGMEEYRRDSQQYRRLWTHLARKHGWLDDEDWPPPEPQGS